MMPCHHLFYRPDRPVDWIVSPQPVDYEQAMRTMDQRVAAIRKGTAHETIWLLEHPALYTAGTSARAGDLLNAARFPVYTSGRGGQYTYHGPGQRVVYVMLNLQERHADIRAFVQALEDWLMATLAEFGVQAEKRCGRIGLWVTQAQGKEDKIAALGLRIRKGVSLHGAAINIAPDLSHFEGIIPCGQREHGVTSLRALGHTTSRSEVDRALRQSFERLFGPTQSAAFSLEIPDS